MDRRGRGGGRADPRQHRGVTVIWTVGVMAPSGEKVLELDRGRAATLASAHAAAVAALLATARKMGRQQFRLAVADREMTVLPGLTEDGRLDHAGLEQTLTFLHGWP